MFPFQHFDAVVLRAPLYPCGSRPDFRQSQSPFRIGLRAASPEFLRALDATDPDLPLPAKAGRSLLKYQLRASGRSTPFGAFAGLALVHGSDGEAASVTLDAPEAQRFRIQVDARRETELAAAAHRSRGADRIYMPNGTLYRAAHEYRFASAEADISGGDYQLSSVPAEPHLERFLIAVGRGLSWNALLRLVMKDNDVSEQEAQAFLDELVAAQVLVPDSSPPLTSGSGRGAAPGFSLPGQDPLAEIPGSGPLREACFDRIREAFDARIPDRDQAAPDLQIDTFLQIRHAEMPRERLDAITAEFAALTKLAQPCHLPQLEIFKARFAARYEHAAVPLLEALDPDLGIGYGTDATAWTGPLLSMLPLSTPAARAARQPDTMPAPRPDTLPGPLVPQPPDTMPGPIVTPSPDTMPGPLPAHTPDTMPGPVPKTDTMPVPGPARAAIETRGEPRGAYPSDGALAALPDGDGHAAAAGSGVPALVQRKYLQSLREGRDEIVLTDADLESLRPGAAPQFGKTFSLAGAMQNGPDDSWRFSLDYAGGATALSLLGRFCQGDDAIGELAETLAGAEAAAEPECPLAEIVHLPAPGLGNVSRRPLLREFEIPYLGTSGAVQDAQLDVQDLLLQMHGSELCLYSRRLGRRILPRLSTAHNFADHALPVYRLLCELQYQGLWQPAAWDWGVFRDEPVLPAVRYKHIILRKQSWGLSRAELDEGDFDTVRSLRGLPDVVRCGYGDQQLRFDLRNGDEVMLLLAELRGDPRLRLEAAPVEHEAPFLRDAEGRPFVNELIIPLENIAYQAARAWPLLVSAPAVRRSFAPNAGSWHYFRLFCGVAAADRIICDGLQICCNTLLEQRIISRWFFLRYDDGEPELRIRFCLQDASVRPALEAAVTSWLQPYLDTGTLNRLVIDTYRRELERYGSDAIEEVELLFAADSRCVAGFLSAAGEAPDEAERFRFACCAIDALFDDAGVQHDARISVLEPLSKAFFWEHGGGIPLQQALNAAYRQQRHSLEELLSGKEYPVPFTAVLDARSAENRGAFRVLRTRDGGAAEILRKLPDLMHMQINRTFRTAQRRYEMLIYHCLLRHYRSAAVRAEKRGRNLESEHELSARDQILSVVNC